VRNSVAVVNADAAAEFEPSHADHDGDGLSNDDEAIVDMVSELLGDGFGDGSPSQKDDL
jgi:hypothetical protein